MKHTFGVVLSLYCSLVTGLSIPNLLDPLVFTGQTSTPGKAWDRYLQTFLHVILWHTGDAWEPGSKAHKSVQKVRRMHNGVAKRMKEAKGDKDRLYMSQYDMALVQSGFTAAVIMYPRSAGIICTTAELEDYVYFWRGIGYLLGIDDKYNICCGNYPHTYTLCKEIESQLLLPNLTQPPKDFSHMAEAFVAGSNIPTGFTLLTKEAVLAFSLDTLQQRTSRQLGLLDTLRFGYLKTIVFLCTYCPGFEAFCNHQVMRKFESFTHLMAN